MSWQVTLTLFGDPHNKTACSTYVLILHEHCQIVKRSIFFNNNGIGKEHLNNLVDLIS